MHPLRQLLVPLYRGAPIALFGFVLLPMGVFWVLAAGVGAAVASLRRSGS